MTEHILPHNAPQNFDWITSLESWRLEDDTLHLTVRTIEGRDGVLRFQALSPAIWRMTFIPPDGRLDPPTSIVVGEMGDGVSFEVEESDGSLVVTGPAVTLTIERDPWCLTWHAPDGRDVLRENPSDVDGLGRPFVLPLGYANGTDGTRCVTQSFHLRPDEALFGLGEKFTPLNKAHQQIITWTVDPFGSTSERSHKNIPFMLSTRGYGLLLDTGARITWDLGTTSTQSYTITADTAALDAYLIFGPTPADILRHYTALTGHAPVPPKWSFGLWLSSAGTYRDRASMEKLVEGLDEYDLPCDVIHVDTWWMKWRRYCDFQWDEEAFPDPAGFADSLHARGLKLSLWEHPYISVETPLFEDGKAKDYFVKRPDGEVYVIDYGLSLAPRPDGVVRVATPETSWNARVAIIDLTNPDAYRWFQDLHRPVLRQGADVMKTDFGEDIPHDAVFHNGQTGATMHNLYPLIYNRCVFEITQEERGYGLVWSRSGTAGNQRYPVCWSGDPAADFESLAATIRGGLSIGLSGVPFWSNDIGAFRGMPSPRLYARWAQFGLMCSHSRMHGDSVREPWAFGDEVVEIVRRYTNLRYQLFPYLYSLAHDAHSTGLPVLRAMPLAFPNDPNTYDKDLQFMLGPWLLVAPIYDAGERRTVYLPEGRWIEYWTGEVHTGPATLTVDAPLDVLPLFVRGGAIIPMMELAHHIPEERIEPLIVEVYPHERSVYDLHEDDATTFFVCEDTGEAVVFEAAGPTPRNMFVRVKGLAGITGTTVEAGTVTCEPRDDGSYECRVTASRQVRIRFERASSGSEEG